MAYIFGGSTGETADSLKRKRAYVQAMLESAIGQQPQNIGDGIAVIGRALAGKLGQAVLNKQEREGRSSAFATARNNPLVQALLGGGGAPVSGGGGSDVSVGSAGGDYFSNIKSAESGGNPNAKNPKSSATGLYQFTDGTWNAVAKAHPQLGLTPDGRRDPRQQEAAIRAFTADNARSLASAGIEPTGGNLYAAHFLGAGGARNVLTQPDSAPVAAIVGQGVVKANPFLARMTVGDFKRWTASKGGNDTLAGGEESDTLGGGNPRALPSVQKAPPQYPRPDARSGGVIVGNGGPDVPMGDGSMQPVGFNTRGFNPQPPDRPMPSGPMMSPAPQQMPAQGPIPQQRPPAYSSPFMADRSLPFGNPQMAQGMPQQAPTPQLRPQMAPQVDPMQTAAIQQQMRPRGIVSPRAEDNGYTRGPGAAPQNMMPGQGGQGGGLLARLLMRQPMPQPAQGQPVSGGGGAPVSGGGGNDSLMEMYALIDNPYLPESYRAALVDALKQKQQQGDPSYQADLAYKQAQTQKLQQEMSSDGSEIKVVGDRAIRMWPDGRTEDVTPEVKGGDGSGAFRFKGNAVDAQALNGLIESGKITPEQAQNIAAGKTVTGPNGEVYFFRADQLVTQPPEANAAPNGDAPSAPAAGPNQLTRGKTALTPEAAARVAMGTGFLERYQTIEDEVKAGGLTGLWDSSMASVGRGRQGDLRRQIQSGTDGLLRMLTGAAQPETEALRYIKRYEPTWMDDAETATLKLQGLKYDLEHVDEAIKRGREEGLFGGGAATGGGGGVKLRRFNKKTGKLEDVSE